jgi:hypothetical protein
VPGVIQAARWQQMPSTVLFDIHAWRARRIPWGRTEPSSDYTRAIPSLWREGGSEFAADTHVLVSDETTDSMAQHRRMNL